MTVGIRSVPARKLPYADGEPPCADDRPYTDIRIGSLEITGSKHGNDLCIQLDGRVVCCRAVTITIAPSGRPQVNLDVITDSPQQE